MTKHTMLLIMITIVGLSSIVGVIYSHEEVHQTIYESYNINSTISMFPRQMTTADSPCPTEECVLAHNINEAISYVLIPMFAFFVLFCILVLIEFNSLRESNEEIIALIEEENSEAV